ncbi:MAG: 3-hydroxyacyl-CoA dehydrogenase NAD-binding domain-containing protein, partial [Myxococcota bacterium]
MAEIHTIGVVGAGQMGNGIAHVAAAAEYQVCLTDISQAALDKARSVIENNLGRQVKKERISQDDATATIGRIRFETDMAAVADAQLVVEAATERVELKYQIFERLSEIASPGTILASNTSSISITSIASHTDRPELVMGMHFMNPVPVMKLVELIRGLQTSDSTFAAVEAASHRMGKTTVVARDVPGFLVNRILMPYINEACQALYEGIGTPEDIDVAMKLGTN